MLQWAVSLYDLAVEVATATVEAPQSEPMCGLTTSAQTAAVNPMPATTTSALTPAVNLMPGTTTSAPTVAVNPMPVMTAADTPPSTPSCSTPSHKGTLHMVLQYVQDILDGTAPSLPLLLQASSHRFLRPRKQLWQMTWCPWEWLRWVAARIV